MPGRCLAIRILDALIFMNSIYAKLPSMSDSYNHFKEGKKKKGFVTPV